MKQECMVRTFLAGIDHRRLSCLGGTDHCRMRIGKDQHQTAQYPKSRNYTASDLQHQTTLLNHNIFMLHKRRRAITMLCLS